MSLCDLIQGFTGSSGCCTEDGLWGDRNGGQELVIWTGWWQRWGEQEGANLFFCGENPRVGRGLAQGHAEQGCLGSW